MAFRGCTPGSHPSQVISWRAKNGPNEGNEADTAVPTVLCAARNPGGCASLATWREAPVSPEAAAVGARVFPCGVMFQSIVDGRYSECGATNIQRL
jgi:hypothetical protein